MDDGPRTVGFDAYLSRGVRTRAGEAGVLDGNSLKDTGFGVFCYSTGANTYLPSGTPDFMYNQQVTYEGAAWDYAPVKYWPNREDGRLSYYTDAEHLNETVSLARRMIHQYAEAISAESKSDPFRLIPILMGRHT